MKIVSILSTLLLTALVGCGGADSVYVNTHGDTIADHEKRITLLEALGKLHDEVLGLHDARLDLLEASDKEQDKRLDNLEALVAQLKAVDTQAAKDLATAIEEIELTPGPKGEDGVDGLSAFDIWVDAYCQDGLTLALGPVVNECATVEAFLSGIRGEQGERGVRGKSAYAVWRNYCRQEFEGESRCSRSDFFADLTGEQGETGEQGLSAFIVWKNRCKQESEGEARCWKRDFFAFLTGEQGIQGNPGLDGANYNQADISEILTILETFCGGANSCTTTNTITSSITELLNKVANLEERLSTVESDYQTATDITVAITNALTSINTLTNIPGEYGEGDLQYQINFLIGVLNSVQSNDGASCTVTKANGVATITCGDDTSATISDGTNGDNGTNAIGNASIAIVTVGSSCTSLGGGLWGKGPGGINGDIDLYSNNSCSGGFVTLGSNGNLNQVYLYESTMVTYQDSSHVVVMTVSTP
jgi:hypothetical protein